MNDIWAIELFSIENLIKLLECPEKSQDEIEYMAAFTLWYASIGIDGLTRHVRLSLLKISFLLLARWIRLYQTEQQMKRKKHLSLPNRQKWKPSPYKFPVVLSDGMRYLNSIPFLYWIIRDYEDAALNRIGTHSVEHFFALIRLAAHSDHSWERFLSAAAKGILVGEILAVHNLKDHMRRDFSVGGVKVFNQGENDDKLELEHLLQNGLNIFAPTRPVSKVQGDLEMKNWIHDLALLRDWKNDKHSAPLYEPGCVASQSALSRIIGFQSDSEKRVFRWTEPRRALALMWHNNSSKNLEEIARDIGHNCTASDVERLIQGMESRTVEGK
jgi:hypothetical protein